MPDTTDASMDWPLLGKLLRLTTSNHDSEVLIAIRRANTALAQANMGWDDIVLLAQAGQQKKPIAPQALTVRGNTIRPPYGSTWRQSVHHLLDQHGHRLLEPEQWLLDRLAVTLANHPRLAYPEGVQVGNIYRRVIAASLSGRRG